MAVAVVVAFWEQHVIEVVAAHGAVGNAEGLAEPATLGVAVLETENAR